jgi:hypothetical protein
MRYETQAQPGKHEHDWIWQGQLARAQNQAGNEREKKNNDFCLMHAKSPGSERAARDLPVLPIF